MPFADEVFSHGVVVVDPRAEWPREFEELSRRVRDALGSLALAIDHIGSTSVPGLAAKDCIDVQVRVAQIASEDLVAPMSADGFRWRPEPWNAVELTAGVECAKLVFAPPAGGRPCNVHVRLFDGPNTRYALLFRDYLRADDQARDAWGSFKRRLALSVPDLLEYGQIKARATEVLMAGAERWAAHTGWSVPPAC